MIETPNLKLQYEGSVKNVFRENDDSDTLWFSFTDKYSVFDWGEMPDLIVNKGNALALIGSHIFKKLSDPLFWQKLPDSVHLKKFAAAYLEKRFTNKVFSGNAGLIKNGLPSHFVALYEGIRTKNDTTNNWQQLKVLASNKTKEIAPLKEVDLANQLLIQVLGADVGWPALKTIMNENLYFYPPENTAAPRRLIPLEVVFSFGLLDGSSLKRKLDQDPSYCDTLALPPSPKLNQWFAQPVLQFFSKLEPKDRLLTWQEAALLANLSANQFEEMVELAIDTALALHALFAEHDLELWDGKLEFIFDSKAGANKSGQLLLADCVGPDEIRLLYKGIHLSKEVLRQHYRPTAWYKSLTKARNIAAKNGQENWQEICRDQLKISPALLPVELKQIVSQLYGMLANELTGETIFPQHPDLQEFSAQLEKILESQRELSNA